MRRKTRPVKIGNRYIGGEHPISIQSMTNTDTRDVKKTVDQIHRLEEAGCDLVRLAVPDETAALAIGQIKKNINIPLVADIHFDHQLALLSMAQGIDKLRINPGNIGDKNKVREIVAMAKDRGIPIRIGVNAGSLDKELLEESGGHPTPGLMVESARRHIEILEELNFSDIVVSLKASDVRLSIDSYRAFSKEYDYPLHLGITEAGLLRTSAVKSAIGLGNLLLDGIGDTLRVSVTGDPVTEIAVGRDILSAIGLYQGQKAGVSLIACPTCGRTEIDLIGIAGEVDCALQKIDKKLTVAVMGCIVNGPGEAKEADIGIAGGKNKAVLFKKGQILKTVAENQIITALLEEINKM
ncbi:flavodoxin-dependent (E)-4-hydroxy-3-methylbut-2-enyl-diphosphate synthase [Eubacteriaceae bacterium ES3]|nr:flavodoxin-dependent (E)-4-hydroxy-3-methylbut-2-enyl-diphosphate synthase [Eubacteriaceae bacterium ES3]